MKQKTETTRSHRESAMTKILPVGLFRKGNSLRVARSCTEKAMPLLPVAATVHTDTRAAQRQKGHSANVNNMCVGRNLPEDIRNFGKRVFTRKKHCNGTSGKSMNFILLKKACFFALAVVFSIPTMFAAVSEFNNNELQVRTLTVPFQKDTVKHFRVKTTGEWKLTTDQDWISLSPSSGGKGEFTITAKIRANSRPRTGSIKLTAGKYFGWVGVDQVDAVAYYPDGYVLRIHKANPPKGRKAIPIFVIGDGWDMSDFKKGGVFETYSRGLYKIFSNVDVIRNFPEYFDFYAYFSESEQRGKFGFNQFGTRSHVPTDFGKMEEYCQQYLKKNKHPNANEATYICASNAAVGGFALAGKFAILSNPSGQPGSYAYWLVHEYAGHCLANMPDLYLRGGWIVDRDSPKAKDPVTGRMHPTTYNKGTVKDVVNMVRNFTREWARGYDWYIDWSDDPKEVVWKEFIGKPGYKNVGVYPTAFNAMFAGFFGPEQLEAMRELHHLWYGLGVRMAVWNRILERSGVKNEEVPNWLTNPDADHPRSLKSFKEFDVKYGYNNDGKHVNDFVEHPIFTAKYWIEDNYLYPERPDFEGAEGNTNKKPLVVPFPSSLRFSLKGGEESVIITSNKADWKAETDADWLKLSATSGKGNGTFKVTAKPGQNRKATIKLTAPNAFPRIITVEQSDTALASDFFNQQISPAEKIIAKHTIKYTQPPRRIPTNVSVDAPLLGNGYVGVAISGAPEKQVFYAARNDFWRLKSLHIQGFPAVLGMIELNLPQLKGASYSLEQKLFDATTSAKFKKKKQTVTYDAYIAATDDVFVIELKMEGEGSLEGNVRLVAPPPVRGVAWKAEISRTEDNIYFLTREFTEAVDIPTKASIALRIDGYGTDDTDGKFVLSAANPVWIVCAFSSNFKSKNCKETAIQKVTACNNEHLNELATEHKNWWRDYWAKSYVSLPSIDAAIERQYYVSLYGMGSCSRDKDFPPALFGTWITKEIPAWSGDYHLNYNHNAPFYGLYSSNRIEQADPYYAPLLAFIHRGRYYSDVVTKIRGGILLPVGIGPIGIETTRVTAALRGDRTHDSWRRAGNIEDEGMFWGQKSNAAYAVVNLSMQFYHTYDKEFTDKVYPFVRDVAYFWEQYLKFENNRYVIYNDSIHEGSIGSFNAILSLGLVRMVMQTARDMSILLDVDADKREKWMHIQTHLARFPTQDNKGKTIFRLTEKGMAWASSNTLGIQHIYPAGQIGLDSDAKLLEISRNTLAAKQRWIDGNGSNSFFPAAVRVGIDAEIILQQLSRYSQHIFPNGFQKNNPHGIENWSTVPNTINEMLCMGHQDIVRLFPVWPRNKNARFHQIRVEGAFLVSAELKDGEVADLSIHSEGNRTLNLLNPWSGKKIKVVEKNADKTERVYSGKRVQISTKQNTTYQLTPI